MRVLLGTTNPSKVKRFSDLLKGYDIEFITLRDIEVIAVSYTHLTLPTICSV